MAQALTQVKKVLIAEDEAALRSVLKDHLEGRGFEVLEARNGKEALEIALRERPDILLLDIMMPRVNGMRVMHQIRKADAWGKDVPIMLITNLSANQKILEGVVEDKPVYYIEKAGYSIREVIEKVEMLAAAKQAVAIG